MKLSCTLMQIVHLKVVLGLAFTTMKNNDDIKILVFKKGTFNQEKGINPDNAVE